MEQLKHIKAFSDIYYFGNPEDIVALFPDGGVMPAPKPFPASRSPYGGVWAFCGVDMAGRHIVEASGYVPAAGTGGALETVTNNMTEFIAAAAALEAVPVGWTGYILPDSHVTIGRLFDGNKTKGLPAAWVNKALARLSALEYVKPVLLQGHPTRIELAQGFGEKHGMKLPVSIHNVWADDTCGLVKKKVCQRLGIWKEGKR